MDERTQHGKKKRGERPIKNFPKKKKSFN